MVEYTERRMGRRNGPGMDTVVDCGREREGERWGVSRRERRRGIEMDEAA